MTSAGGTGRGMRSYLGVVACLAAAALAAGCGGSDGDDDTPSPGIANPASEFCVQQGGEVDIVDEEGGQVGYCTLPDGTRVEEWEYFRANSTTVP